MALIDAHRDRWGVESICQALEVAPSTYYAATSRPTSARRVRDDELKIEIARVHAENFGVYGVEKVWRQLNREGVRVGRDRVARLMRELDLEGVVRGKRKRTTVAGELDERPADLVDRNFRAAAPNRLWVADLVRHEALLNRAEVQGLRRQPVAAGRRSWGQSEPGGAGKGGKQSRQRRGELNCRTARARQARRKVYERNQRLKPLNEAHQLKPGG